MKHDQGRAELSHGRFLLDPGIFAWVEQALDTAENCSTPCARPRIRPGRFCLGRIPGLRPGVEQVSGRMGGWLDRGRNAPVEIPPDPQILSWGIVHKPITLSCTIRAQAHLGPKFGMVGPGWFEAMTCNIWLRLEYRLVDSAWFFSAQLWYFQPQGPFLGSRIPNLDPGWAGDLFSAKMGAQKT